MSALKRQITVNKIAPTLTALTYVTAEVATDFIEMATAALV